METERINAVLERQRRSGSLILVAGGGLLLTLTVLVGALVGAW